MLYENRRVKTGKPVANLNTVRVTKGEWFTSLAECKPSPFDGHTFELCLFNIGPGFKSPLWPLLAFFDAETGRHWERKLRKFARTLSPEKSYEHLSAEYNGDKRLGDWLKENGFQRFNHVWWTLKNSPPTATDL